MSLEQHLQDDRVGEEYIPRGSTLSDDMLTTFTSFLPYNRHRHMRKLRRQSSSSGLTSGSGSSTNSNSGKTGSSGSGNSGSGNSNQPGFSPFFAPGFMFVRDNDPRLVYQGPWILSGTQMSTSHSTTQVGSSFSLSFNGSGLIVFGTVPVSSSSDPPPQAVYHIDGEPFPTTIPFATADVPNQPLFATSVMLNSSVHSITVNVTDIVSKPYIFQSILIFSTPSPGNKDSTLPFTSTTGTKATAPTGTETSSSSHSGTAQGLSTKHEDNPQKTIGILAGLLGAFLFLVIFALAIFFMLKRRAARRNKEVKRAATTTSNSEKHQSDSMFTSFTSTESILRHDSIWSPIRSPHSHYSRGASSHSASGRTSTVEPPLPRVPPKSASLLMLPPH